jgi:hypothetical protein
MDTRSLYTSTYTTSTGDSPLASSSTTDSPLASGGGGGGGPFRLCGLCPLPSFSLFLFGCSPSAYRFAVGGGDLSPAYACQPRKQRYGDF